MKWNQIGGWLAVGAVGLVMFGCEGTPLSPLGTFDLTEYLFPKKSGTLVYQVYTSDKEKDASTFTEEAYQEDAQYAVERNGSVVTVADKGDLVHTMTYAIGSRAIAVEERDENLSYHFDRSAHSVTNFVQEGVLRETKEDAGTSRITYECNASNGGETMTIDPNPKIYKDILKIVCVRRDTIYATVGGKRFQTVVETTQERFAAKEEGVIQSEETTCNYTQVDDSVETEGSCARKTYKIWAFVEE